MYLLLYENLTRCIERNGRVILFDEQEELRDEKDWIESDEFSEIYEAYRKSQQSNVVNEGEPFELSVEGVQKWYHNRSVEIENMTGLVDIALNFAELAIVNGCKNMNELIENLRTLFTLVYKCSKCSGNTRDESTFYTLEYVAKLSDFERLELIMSHAYESGHEFYVKNLQEWLLPFVSRQPTHKQKEALLKAYLVHVSKEDLQPCLKLMHIKQKITSPSQISSSQAPLSIPAHFKLLLDVNLTSILLECLYVNERSDQIDLAHQIVNELCKISVEPGLKPAQTQQEQIRQALEHLRACELFRKYGLSKTLSYVKDSCANAESCRNALTKLTWFASKRTTQLRSNEWAELLKVG